jgi:hypothetical protein
VLTEPGKLTEVTKMTFKNGAYLEIVRLSEINGAQKDKYCMFSLICRLQTKKSDKIIKGGYFR